ncbi:MAG: hypothetical protein IJY39_03430 [Clostridia bacterium]|nr:hypothetical protein [Clostridia bacterium]
MTDYKSTDSKMVFSPRMQRVREDILARLQPNRTREGTYTCPVEAEMLTPFTDEFREHPERPYVINLANGIVRSWTVSPCVILRGEAIVGITRPIYPVLEHFSWGLLSVDSLKEDPSLDEEEKETLRRRMEPLDASYIGATGAELFGSREAFEAVCNPPLFGAGGYQGHTVPDYPRLLELGLDGMLAYIDRCAASNQRDSDTLDFYEANRIIIRGMSAWLEAYADKARELARGEVDETQRTYYCEIAANCAHSAHKKPETLYQAVQLMWCLSLWDWVDCVGRMDQYLFPFYCASLKYGDVISVEDAMTDIMFKLWENGCHNITVGGVHPEDGSDAANDLTFLSLQILRTIHDTHPRMSVRIHRDTPKALLDLIVGMWAEGMSDPTVVSDENVILGLERIGVPLRDARDYTMLGCQEIEIPGKSNFGCEDGCFNLARILEITLYGGRTPQYPDVQLGPDTGRFEDFDTFEDFFAAFEAQIRYFVAPFLTMCDRGQVIRGANFAKLVKTPFTQGCLEKGIPHDKGGPLYNYGVIETAGLAAVADALTAVKKLVFDENKISKEALMSAIKANYEGYERIRQMLLNAAPKFGNDDEDADGMAVRVLDLFWDEIGKYNSIRGDRYVGACSLLDGGILYGSFTGTIPDGRFGGEPLGNTIGPRPGADHCGVTAMLNSVAKLPLHKGVGGTTLNVVLTTELLSDPVLRDKIAAMIKTYLMNGGQMAQITTANLDDLLDARCHPERHGDLIVRIGGFSIQFVQLGAESQDEIISRYQT